MRRAPWPEPGRGRTGRSPRTPRSSRGSRRCARPSEPPRRRRGGGPRGPRSASRRGGLPTYWRSGILRSRLTFLPVGLVRHGRARRGFFQKRTTRPLAGGEGRVPVQGRQQLVRVSIPDAFGLEIETQLLQERIPLPIQGLLLLAEGPRDVRQREPGFDMQAQDDAIPGGQAPQRSPQDPEGLLGQGLPLGLLDRGGPAP